MNNVATASINFSKEDIKRSARLLEVLLAVHNRISSNEEQSDTFNFSEARACIDKVNMMLEFPLPLSSLDAKRYKIKNLNGRVRTASFNGEETGTFAVLHGRYDSPVVAKLITRPSAFKHFSDYKNHLDKNFGEEVLGNTLITRTDFALDLKARFNDVLGSLDILNKRASVKYLDSSGVRTGAMFGKGNEKITVYDKQIRHKLKNIETRIEVQLSGGKKPCRRLSELQSIVASGFNPFKPIDLKTIQYREPFSEHEIQKFQQLKRSIEHDGLYATRKQLNQQGNFKRDYGKYLELESRSELIKQVFDNDMKDYWR